MYQLRYQMIMVRIQLISIIQLYFVPVPSKDLYVHSFINIVTVFFVFLELSYIEELFMFVFSGGIVTYHCSTSLRPFGLHAPKNSSNPVHGKVYSIHYMLKKISDL